MAVEISPEPDEAERKAIVAALAAAEDEVPTPSEWQAALLPSRQDDDP